MRESACGEVLRRRRAELGWTQEELARRAGVSVRTLRNLERADRPDADRVASVEQVRRALGLLPDQEVGGGPDGAVRLAVLGPLRLTRAGRPVPLTAAKPRRMLALLAIQPGTDVGRDEIADVLWPATPPATWQNVLHTYAARLRRLLPSGEDAIRLDRTSGGYRLRADARHLDVVRFVQLTGDGTGDDGGPDGADAARLAEALDCWRGDVCADLPDQLCQHPAAVALHRRRVAAALRYADLALPDGEHAAVARRLRVVVGAEPVHEPLHARLIVALAGSGQRAEAVESFHLIRARLDEELGLYPGAELAAALDQALRDDHRQPVDPPAPVPPAQLPAQTAGFVGRADELAWLDKVLAESGSRSAVAVVHGTAGVGKTTLALHWAHRHAHRFPDGQLYLNLRGYDPAGAAVEPAAALRALLEALGIRSEHVPEGQLAQQGLYHSLIASRRMLVVLDNARDADQVRPLLPGVPGSMALVTSRDSLIGLIATDQARAVPLELFTVDEAREFFTERLGDDRARLEPDAVDRLIGRCARLPLALAVAAALAVSSPGQSLAAIAAELDDAEDLASLASGDPLTDLRTVFSCSYRTLSGDGARLFRYLGLHPGPTVSVPAVASLLGHPRPRARALLGELHRAHLVSLEGPGRYTLHDLLRTYATALARDGIPDDDRDLALRRTLDHYLHTAYEADRTLYVRLDAVAPPERHPDAVADSFTEQATALAWFEDERPVLLRVIDLAAILGQHTHAWQLAWTISMFLNRRGHWADWAHAQQRAIDATAGHDDTGQAQAHRMLGLVYLRMNRADEAHTQLRHARTLFRRLGDRAGEANAERGIGRAYARQDRHDKALEHTRTALELFRATGNRSGEASALGASGWYHAQLGEHHVALAHCREAIALGEELGDHSGQANAWDSLGYAHRALGDHASAIRCYQRSVRLHQLVGDLHAKSDTLTSLGDVQLDAGDPDAAHQAWQAALTALTEIGHPNATGVRARLARLLPQPRGGHPHPAVDPLRPTGP